MTAGSLFQLVNFLTKITLVTMTSFAALKNLFATYILITLIFSTVETYKCVECPANQCSDDVLTTCESSHGCYSKNQEFTGHPKIVLQQKGCSSSRCVPLAFSASFGSDKTFRYEHKCCQTEECNKKPIVEQGNSLHNGITCPACYSEDSIFCNPSLLKCTGAETKCIEIFGSNLQKYVIYGMGCATETACNMKNSTVLNNIKIRTFCADQRSGSPTLTSITSLNLICLYMLNALL
ncbi:PREDICTED: protein RoBo-1-like [Condylura cristata]|uniref:protein RoBo-1-like n=1 Tax=Condylura cristata TaxID=143302 RepID=UPI0006434F0B|nr:PREDICTED: protein RoBo-1-like [Condylura cristata]